METRNAVIKAATITNDDHGLLSAWLTLDYGGTGQGFGGYALYLPESYRNHKTQLNYAGHFIFRVLAIAGVEEWGKLVGRTIRAKTEHAKAHTIGHIVNDDWFDPAEDFAAMNNTAGLP